MANPTLLDMPIARDGNKNAIPTTDNGTTGLLSQQYGWQLINAIPPQQGGKAVKREDFNGALYLLSNLLFYLQKGWQFEWNSRQAYYAGCIVKDTSDGKMYQCLNDITSTTAPHSDTTNWKLWDLSMLANYLPLSGGHLTGDYVTIDLNNSNGAILFMAGLHNSFEGANLQLNGPNRSTNPGYFNLIAQDGNASKILRGTPDGTLTWNGHNVLTDANGGYLPLSGGKMTGPIVGKGDTSALSFAGGENLAAFFTVYGKDNSSRGGQAVMGARNATSEHRLTAYPNGDLTWGRADQTPNDLGGASIVAKSIGGNGYILYSSRLMMCWGTEALPTTAPYEVSITFPLSFNEAPKIVSTPFLQNSNMEMVALKDQSVSYAGFTIQATGYCYMQWVAIGYK